MADPGTPSFGLPDPAPFSGVPPYSPPDLEAGTAPDERSTEIRAALDAIPDKVVCQDRSHTVHWANRAALGDARHPGELLGRKCHEVWHDRATPCASCPTEEALATGVPAERSMPTADGRRWEVRAIPLRDAHGEVSTALKIVRDVTHREERDRERDELLRELGERNRELGEFAHTVAHDLKGPLVSLKGYAGLARQDLARGRTGELASHLARVEDAADQMARLIDGLLDLSTAGATVGSLTPVSLAEVCEEARDLLRWTLRGQTVACALPQGLPPVRGDRNRLLQLLLNLLGNAAKFTEGRPAPRIVLEGRIEGGSAVCTIADNGEGVPPDRLEWIFGIFHKADPRGPGNGLGLAIAKRIVDAHGGRIWAESDGVGKGFRVIFSLPLAH